jgi:hypothetical protein
MIKQQGTTSVDVDAATCRRPTSTTGNNSSIIASPTDVETTKRRRNPNRPAGSGQIFQISRVREATEASNTCSNTQALTVLYRDNHPRGAIAIRQVEATGNPHCELNMDQSKIHLSGDSSDRLGGC